MNAAPHANPTQAQMQLARALFDAMVDALSAHRMDLFDALVRNTRPGVIRSLAREAMLAICNIELAHRDGRGEL